MATIYLHSDKINYMPMLINDLKQAVDDFHDELSKLHRQIMRINRSVCDLDDVSKSIKSILETQAQKIASLETLEQNVKTFTAEVAEIDEEVAALITQRKNEFYDEYEYLKPECEKAWIEKIRADFKDLFPAAHEWCQAQWKELRKAALEYVIEAAEYNLAALDFLVRGDYSPSFNLGGLLSSIIVGCTPVGVVADGRDFVYAVSHTRDKDFGENVGLIGLGLLSFVPVLGDIKHLKQLKQLKNLKQLKSLYKVDDVGKIIAGTAKNVDELWEGVGEAAEGAAKYGDDVGEAGVGSGAGRTFTSPDRYVGETANAIEAKYPGRVTEINKIVKDSYGRILTDYDIELDNIVIQVKSGTAKGLTTQIQNTAASTEKIVIGYTPDLNPSSAVIKGVQNAGYNIFTNLEELLNFLD